MTTPFDAHLVGLPPGYVPMHVADAGSWRIAAELIRRHPDDLRVIEMHPGDGQHDCLAIMRPNEEHRYGLSRLFFISRKTTGHVLPGELAKRTEWRPTWLEILMSDSLIDDVIRPLEEIYELDSPDESPPLTSSTVGPWVIAEALNRGLRAGRTMTAFNGVYDSSGYSGSSVQRSAFRHFPRMVDELGRSKDTQLEKHPAYRFWFVASQSEEDDRRLHFGLDSWNGRLWTADRSGIDILVECGQRGDSLIEFVNELLTTTSKEKS